MDPQKILLSHGSGGTLMHGLIKELLLKKFHNPILKELSDSAFINYKEKIAFTTDSFVVNPLIFYGGDIGKLAVYGTVNDLVMIGAVPEYLSLAFILEEGLEMALLERITDSLSAAAKSVGIYFVTGDLKVVEKGACDKMFINTAGIGRIVSKKKLSLRNIVKDDKIILTGNLGQHGLAILAERQGLDLGFRIRSDCAALNSLIAPLLKKNNAIKFMRDPTRGGLAATLNEIAQGSSLGIVIKQKCLPITEKVRVACELLGIDPLYVANEGIAVMIVEKAEAQKIVNLLRKHPLGRNAQIIGAVTKEFKGQVVLNTSLGTQRIVDMPSGEQFPRIC